MIYLERNLNGFERVARFALALCLAFVAYRGA